MAPQGQISCAPGGVTQWTPSVRQCLELPGIYSVLRIC